jgi:hypothetical protein
MTNQSEIDDNTKYLMMLHEQIIPTPNFVRQSLINIHLIVFFFFSS